MTTADWTVTLIFYLLGGIALIASIVAVASKRILRAAVGLAVTLACTAGFYVLLGYDFLAGVQLLVYVGGIVVLIVYAIMLTSSMEYFETRSPTQRRIIGAIVAAIFLVVTVAAFRASEFTVTAMTVPPSDIAAGVGRLLLDQSGAGYLLPFEVISLLLLASVLGGVVIARSPKAAAADASPDIHAPHGTQVEETS